MSFLSPGEAAAREDNLARLEVREPRKDYPCRLGCIYVEEGRASVSAADTILLEVVIANSVGEPLYRKRCRQHVPRPAPKGEWLNSDVVELPVHIPTPFLVYVVDTGKQMRFEWEVQENGNVRGIRHSS